MPTFDEISKDYADRIKRAIAADRFTKTASLTESVVSRSHVAAELKAIAADVKKWQLDDVPLTESQIDQIERGAAEQLNLPDSSVMPRAIKNASNDAFLELVNDIGTIVRKSS